MLLNKMNVFDKEKDALTCKLQRAISFVIFLILKN